MKWYQSHNAVIEAFVDAPMDERGGRASNLFFEDGVLYSYGHHFPLAIPLRRNAYKFFVVNGDNYSSSTAAHRGKVFRAISQEKYAVIPFTALNSMLRDVYSKIIDEYSRSYSFRSYFSFSLYEFYFEKIIMNEVVVIDHTADTFEDKTVMVRNRDTGEMEEKVITEHLLGSTLFEICGDYYLSSVDPSGKGRGLYFLTKLPRPADSIEDAYASIKPKGLNGEAYVRQGEFFFVPQEGMTKPRGIDLEKKVLIENRGRDAERWRHVATEGFRLDGVQYVRGTVRHPEHKMCSLGNVWHRVYEAQGAGTHGAIVSWSSGGGFD